MALKPRYNQKINLTIQSIGKNGEGVGYWHGYTVFVSGALPQETIRAKMIEINKSYGRGQIVAIVQPSPDRVEPPCPYFNQCGGCQLMHVGYAKQLELKRQRVIDALAKEGLSIDVPACEPSVSPLYYRNKIQMPVEASKEGLLKKGLYSQFSHELIYIDTCPLHTSMGEEIVQKAWAILEKSALSGFEPELAKGDLRFLVVRTTFYTREALVLLVTNGEVQEDLIAIGHEIMRQCPEVKGVLQNVNPSVDNVVLKQDSRLLCGRDYIEEKIEDLVFRLSAESFFQVNTEQMRKLYAKAIDFLDPRSDQVVLDGFSGVGTLSAFLAKKVKKVIGIEYVLEAVENAKYNAALNKQENLEFMAGDIEKLIDQIEPLDAAILNPPRKGCESAFLDKLLQHNLQKLVYISCEPQSLARDLSYLCQRGYHLEKIHLFDMFPQTYHVESVALLTRNNAFLEK